MGWTAIDIRNQRFRKRWRGFDPEEVILFLNMVADEVERLTHQLHQLEHENDQLKRQLEEYREKERYIRNTLVAVQQSADQIRAQAQRDAELLIREAELQRDQIVAQTQVQIEKIYSDMETLVLEYRRLQDRILSEIQVLARWIQQRRAESPPGRVQLIDAASRKKSDSSGNP